MEIRSRGNAGYKFLTIPYYPVNSENKGYEYEIYTAEFKIISEYSGLNFIEVSDLDFDVYKLLFRDAYIWKLQQTERGQEYMQNAYILEQSNPDREKLRQHFQKESDDK
ncbi:MAG: hypothetical protein AAGU76_02730 [Sedimentibacter sp.]|uniref:hypothetical protein n=1 Tax=Sedimentibacter sp. TaxID=1960295 RepID=UPI003158D15A